MTKIYRFLIISLCIITIAACFAHSFAFADSTCAPPIDWTNSSGYIDIIIGGMPYRVNSNLYVSYNPTVYLWEAEVIQRALTAINGQNSGAVSCDPQGIDGYFGTNSCNALYSFQSFANTYYSSYFPSEYFYSAPDGICGPVTWSRLQRICY